MEATTAAIVVVVAMVDVDVECGLHQAATSKEARETNSTVQVRNAASKSNRPRTAGQGQTQTNTPQHTFVSESYGRATYEYPLGKTTSKYQRMLAKSSLNAVALN